MDIKTLILQTAKRRGSVKLADIARASGFSRAYVHRFFQELRIEGKIVLLGSANKARYVIAHGAAQRRVRNTILEVHRILRNDNLSEDRVLDDIRQHTGVLTRPAKRTLKIVEYAFTEMLNNAIEHSRSEKIDLRMKRSDDTVYFKVRDWGIGIFKNIKESRHLASETEAIQDLLKGKQTTAPDQHSGEGIFFTSKAVDRLVLKGSEKKLTFDNTVQDVFVQDSAPIVGTSVECWVSRLTSRDLASIFREYTNEEFQFDRTRVTVQMYKTAGSFVSRSQARRLLANLDQFKVVALDFKNVETVGQGFADEVFRVWVRHHPAIRFEILNAGQNVQLMINHARSADAKKA